ncbi:MULTISPECIES: TcpQ domain-containing protein [Cysteiniphilum]|uniref:TcpQ domain-containing protein n=1 Tax=Cysteiniphilum TaxID=2056696 RepID=UPI00177EB47F|nr:MULTISPECIES: TcpQ domain-containing protein [Cysteiniphilum]
MKKINYHISLCFIPLIIASCASQPKADLVKPVNYKRQNFVVLDESQLSDEAMDEKPKAASTDSGSTSIDNRTTAQMNNAKQVGKKVLSEQMFKSIFPKSLWLLKPIMVQPSPSISGYKLLKDNRIAKQKSKTKKTPRNLYHLFEGETVRQTINRWGKLNGYKIIYQVDYDFVISQNTEIKGEFLSKNGALFQLLKSLKQTSSPIKATVMSNHVILIQADEYNSSLLMPTQ